MEHILERDEKLRPDQGEDRTGPGLAGRLPSFDRQRWEERRRQAAQNWKIFKEWARIHLRRAAHVTHGALAVHRAVGPATFLGTSLALGVVLTLTTLYTASYAVTVDGEAVGVVADQAVVERAIDQVEQTGSSLLGYDYQVKGDVEALQEMLEELKNQYVNENTTSVEFVEDVSIDYVYAADDLLTVDEMRQALEANSTGETTYTVVKGDTFNAIAYANDMSVSDLKALNPDVDINRLMIGDVLNVKELIPVLSVQTTEHQVYTQAIECPVEEVEDSSMYIGDSKILTQGEEGEAQIEADVVYVNGYERERTVLSSTTLREPTTTVKAVGTKEKPKTASTGSYSWPIRGRITSYFGGRYIFGSYSYHSGLDISCSYGASIKAADGGRVTFAGYKGSYGYLVIITHDNGTQTYYAHNSSLLVSAGDKVYKGQAIAKAGSTGRSTGTHCHFEVRVNGTAVNPLNYLS